MEVSKEKVEIASRLTAACRSAASEDQDMAQHAQSSCGKGTAGRS